MHTPDGIVGRRGVFVVFFGASSGVRFVTASKMRAVRPLPQRI
jgi:hypothetical protein